MDKGKIIMIAEKDMYHAIKKKLLEDGLKEDLAKTKATKITHAHFNKEKNKSYDCGDN